MGLEAACRALGVEHGKVPAERHGLLTLPYVDYNRRDVEATFELCQKALAEYDRHVFSPGHPSTGYKRPETDVYSAASITKAYLEAMSVQPPRQKYTDFPKEITGACMEAFYGGRAEANIIRCPVPVVYTDFTSMYPTVSALMGLWDLVIASRIDVVDATTEVRRWLTAVGPEDLMRPEAWPTLVGIALVQPTGGDLLPVRAAYGRDEAGTDDPYRIALAYPVFERPVWYTVADLVASKILTGNTPEIVHAVRFVAVGTQEGLRSTHIRGAIEVDPTRDDLFRRLIEERARVKGGQPPYDRLNEHERGWLQQSLKTVANSLFGVMVEINKQLLPGRQRAPVRVWHGQGSYETTARAVEQPGRFFFPPLGALITGGARLMLALLEWQVARRGGTYGFCDTDSMAIVAASRRGSMCLKARGNTGKPSMQQLRVLSWHDIEQIAEAFRALNPYDRDAVPGSILKIEDVNFRDGKQVQLHALVAGTKRYAIYELPSAKSIRITDQYSEHGLGHVLSPVEIRGGEDDWRREVWEYLVRRELTLPARLPPWADHPAAGQHTITTWHLMEAFTHFNRGKPYLEQIKPSNFMSTTLHDPFAASRFKRGLRLIGPFQPDSEVRKQMEWLNLHGGEKLRLARGPYQAAAEVGYLSYGDLIARHLYHRETKRSGPDGLPCGELARGLLGRRIVRPLRIVHIGKEADRHEDRNLATERGGIVEAFGDVPGQSVAERIIRPALKMLLRDVARTAGIDLENLRKIATGKRAPRPATNEKIVAALVATCSADLRALGIAPPQTPILLIKAYLDVRRS
jgi:hypothetical protein